MFNGFFFLGALLTMVGAGYFVSERNFVNSSVTTTGVVIENSSFISKPSSGARPVATTMYTPRIQFKTRTGQEITFDYNESSSTPPFEVGEKVEVLYDPANPEKAFAKTFVGLWLESTVITSVGVLLMAFQVVRAKLDKGK